VLKAILFDLDDTLLANPMAAFVQAYLRALGDFFADRVPPQRLVTELLRATAAMDANDGEGPTNEGVFAESFYPALGADRLSLEPLFQRFYAEEFPKLRSLTRTVPEARLLVRWALDRGLQVVVATNPLFPRTAIEQRLEWAGLGPREYPYALVTTYENMHASKQHPAYYREIALRLDWEPGECLMVGDDWNWDIVNAAEAGVLTWWVADPAIEPPSPAPAILGQGRLADLWNRLTSGRLGPELPPAPRR